MKQTFVTLDKRSKKARKAYYAKQRQTWGELNPVTRTMPNGKAYNRKKNKEKDKRMGREFCDSLSFFICQNCIAPKSVIRKYWFIDDSSILCVSMF